MAIRRDPANMPMLIFVGLDPEVYPAIDAGANRRIAQTGLAAAMIGAFYQLQG